MHAWTHMVLKNHPTTAVYIYVYILFIYLYGSKQVIASIRARNNRQ